MMRGFSLPSVRFAFAAGKLHSDKLRGLKELGPFLALNNERPRFAFLFPREYRDRANSLYLALKNGIGYFGGVENFFRFTLKRSDVFPVGSFEIGSKQPRDLVRAYTDALGSWLASSKDRADLVFIIHPHTSKFDSPNIYYACKALLLRNGLLSQSVTREVIDDPSMFEWSIANIALAAFAKLGGIPWVVSTEGAERDLVVGVGRSDLYDRESRATQQYLGFTACFSARGAFKFMSLGEVASSRHQYLQTLDRVLRQSLNRINATGNSVASLTVHVPKEMGIEELETVKSAVRSSENDRIVPATVAKVSDEASFFAVDRRFPDGVPKRGTAIQVTDRDFLLYTEGRDEKQVWSGRTPTALRVTPQGAVPSDLQARWLLAQINDLSQVNWRGFNARSRPISVHYGALIAEILSHVPSDDISSLYKSGTKEILEHSMWFL